MIIELICVECGEKILINTEQPIRKQLDRRKKHVLDFNNQFEPFIRHKTEYDKAIDSDVENILAELFFRTYESKVKEKEIKEKLSKPIEITDVETYADLERIMIAIVGKIYKAAEKGEEDLWILVTSPELLVQKLNAKFLTELPAEYYKSKHYKGYERWSADGEFWFVKKVPKEVVKETFVKSGILKAV